MDSFLDFLITIALVALFTIPSLLKKKDAAKANTQVPEPDYDYEMEDEREPFLQNSMEEIPKSGEYFTYETIGDSPEYVFTNEAQAPPKKEVQQTDNKVEGNSLLSLDKEEVLKGIIYSEILKRKF